MGAIRGQGEGFVATKPAQWWRDQTQVPLRPAWLTGELERQWPDTQFAIHVQKHVDTGGRRGGRFEYEIFWYGGPTAERIHTFLENEMQRHPEIEFLLHRLLRVRADLGRRLYRRLDKEVRSEPKSTYRQAGRHAARPRQAYQRAVVGGRS